MQHSLPLLLLVMLLLLSGSMKLTMPGWTRQALPATMPLLRLPHWLAACWGTGAPRILAAGSAKSAQRSSAALHLGLVLTLGSW
jgi:hypothetical protein